jgi:hypothetical protein
MAERKGPPPTLHGQTLGIVASQLQKAIRRGQEEIALRAAVELDESGFTEYVWYRLLTVASEDVGLVDSNAVVQVNALHDVALKSKKRPHGSAKSPSARLALVHAVLILVRARKSRVVDHAALVMYDDPQPTPIEDVAMDRHTIEGRRRGRGFPHFFEHGTLLADRETGDLSYAPHLEDPYRERAIAVISSRVDPTPAREPGQNTELPGFEEER